MNIQIIGIFIAIIGGIIATKLLNLKIEKESLKEKLLIINKQIEFDNDRICNRNKKIFTNNREKFIDSIYDHVFEDEFSLEKYNHYGLSDDEIRKIYDEIIEMYRNANILFNGKEYYIDDVDKILSDNKIYDSNEFYCVYYKVGCDKANTESNGLYNIPIINKLQLTFKKTTLQEDLEDRDLIKSFNELNELNEWRMIEKENIEIRIRAIDVNLKFDFFTFGFVTSFGIIIPQIIISIYPLFINFKFFKYSFAIYSFLSFLICMFLMMLYIYKMYNDTKKKMTNYCLFIYSIYYFI